MKGSISTIVGGFAMVVLYSCPLYAGNSTNVDVKKIIVTSDWYGGVGNESIGFIDNNGVQFIYEIDGDEGRRQQSKNLLSALYYAKTNRLKVKVYWWNQSGYETDYTAAAANDGKLPLGSIHIVDPE